MGPIRGIRGATRRSLALAACLAIGALALLVTASGSASASTAPPLGRGVSAASRDQVIAIATVAPVLNQVQFSPFEYRRALLAACRERQVALEAYSPFGTGSHLSDPTVARIAEALGRTPAQVLLRWCLQRETIVIPKSTHRERLAENAQLFDFALSADELADLDALDRTGGTERARERSWW
jgi:diketogulonate reductase-like aldo/keto reductase